MSAEIYTFEEDEEADLVFVNFESPCGMRVLGIAIILEPKSINPVIRLLDTSTGEYTAGLGLNGLSKIIDYVKSRNKEMN